MVGTFYSGGSPDSPPYVSVGQEVTEDTVVCIIEAMKVMNEIKAESRGIDRRGAGGKRQAGAVRAGAHSFEVRSGTRAQPFPDV